MAFAGAYFKANINGRSLPFYQTIDVKDGDVLQLDAAIYGCRTYLAVRGQMEEPKWLGSYSAASQYMSSYGLESHFQDGRVLIYKTEKPTSKKRTPRSKHPMHSHCAIIRTVTGPDFEQFPIEWIQEFYDSVFTLSSECNRMGYRLKEAISQYQQPKEMFLRCDSWHYLNH